MRFNIPSIKCLTYCSQMVNVAESEGMWILVSLPAIRLRLFSLSQFHYTNAVMVPELRPSSLLLQLSPRRSAHRRMLFLRLRIACWPISKEIKLSAVKYPYLWNFRETAFLLNVSLHISDKLQRGREVFVCPPGGITPIFSLWEISESRY